MTMTCVNRALNGILASCLELAASSAIEEGELWTAARSNATLPEPTSVCRPRLPPIDYVSHLRDG